MSECFKMSSLPESPLPEISSFPINGAGGSYYDTAFYIPTYNPNGAAVYNQTSWAEIDTWSQANYNIVITHATALGLCLATTAYLLTLTPARKRSLPFFSLLCLALFFQIFHSLCEVVQAPLPGVSQFSAYIFLTNDLTATTYTAAYRSIRILALFDSSLALLFSFTCLYLQAHGLLSAVRVKHPRMYRPLMIVLVILSFIAQIWSFIFTIFATYRIVNDIGDTGSIKQETLHYGMLVTISIAIGSWSLISLISTTTLIFGRSKLLISRNSLYDSALNLVALICLESFIVPLLFCILQLLPVTIGLLQPELIVLPSVLVLLPLGSLFMTVHNADMNCPPGTSQNTDGSRQPLVAITAAHSNPSVSATDCGTPRMILTATDRELQMIDALVEENDDEHVDKQTSIKL